MLVAAGVMVCAAVLALTLLRGLRGVQAEGVEGQSDVPVVDGAVRGAVTAADAEGAGAPAAGTPVAGTAVVQGEPS